MPVITKDLLEQIDVNISAESVAKLSEHFEATLDERVMSSVIAELSDEQIERLDVIKTGPDEQLMAWLSDNVPELKSIIEDETAILLGELAEGSNDL